MAKRQRGCRALPGNYSWLPTHKKIFHRYFASTQTETENKKDGEIRYFRTVVNQNLCHGLKNSSDAKFSLYKLLVQKWYK